MQKYFPSEDFTLDEWKQSWLLTPSPNFVTVEWDPNNHQPVAILKIKQSAYSPVYPLLRYHKTRIAFFNSDGTYDAQDIMILPQAQTEVVYNGSKKYEAVLVNEGYWGYFKYLIDPDSQLFFKEKLNDIDNVLTRIVIWHDFNEAVRDGNSKVASFLQTFLKFIYT